MHRRNDHSTRRRRRRISPSSIPPSSCPHLERGLTNAANVTIVISVEGVGGERVRDEPGTDVDASDEGERSHESEAGDVGTDDVDCAVLKLG